MTALLLNRVQDEPHRALDLPVEVTDQMGDSSRLRLLGEQLACGSEPLGGSLANLPVPTLEDVFPPWREGRGELRSWCHADPFSNAPAAARDTGRRVRLRRAIHTEPTNLLRRCP